MRFNTGMILLAVAWVAMGLPAQRGQASAPEWAQGVVWYQIFPERFANGDTANDPTLRDIQDSWPHFYPQDWQIIPWTSDWYALQPWEARTGKDFYTLAGLRRYGGDLQGIIDRLDYLQALGVEALYINPIFESPSLHKYDATMYHHVDNNFGPDPEGDRRIWAQEDPGNPATWQWTAADRLFLKLIQEVHRRGMKIIIDGVFNHVGNTFWAFRDVQKNQQQSRYADWFTIYRWDDPTTPENEFDYAGWYGVKELPEIRETAEGPVEGFREHVWAIVRRWMDPNGDGDPSDGIDGWRLDVAEKVSIQFWREFRKRVKAINPEAYIVGELFWEDWAKNQLIHPAPWLQGDVFDGVMNYRFAVAVKRFIIDTRNRLSVAAFQDSMRALEQGLPDGRIHWLQNLMDSHDTDRLASQIQNPDRWYDHRANPAQNPDYDVRRPGIEGWQKFKLIVALQFTLPGAPMVYYGDEAGMWGGDDPDCRKPMVWPDMQYQPESHHPFGKPRPVDSVRFDAAIFRWYQKLIHLKKTEKSLRKGSVHFLPEKEPGVLVFTRTFPGALPVLVIANSTAKRVSVALRSDWHTGDSGQWWDLLADRAVNPRKSIHMAPWEVRILQPR